MTITVAPVMGAALVEVLPALAELRIAVFRAFPYLYDGDAALRPTISRALRPPPVR